MWQRDRKQNAGIFFIVAGWPDGVVGEHAQASGATPGTVMDPPRVRLREGRLGVEAAQDLVLKHSTRIPRMARTAHPGDGHRHLLGRLLWRCGAGFGKIPRLWDVWVNRRVVGAIGDLVEVSRESC